MKEEELNEKIKSIRENLKKGEPFEYYKDKGHLLIGVRCDVDEETYEIETFYAEKYKTIDNKFLKKKKINLSDLEVKYFLSQLTDEQTKVFEKILLKLREDGDIPINRNEKSKEKN